MRIREHELRAHRLGARLAIDRKRDDVRTGGADRP